MPISSSQQKTSSTLNNDTKYSQHKVPKWKAALLEKKRSKSEFPQWKQEIIKRKKVLDQESNLNAYGRLSINRKSYHSSVPCLSTYQDEDIYEEINERIVPININPIVLLDQEKRRSLNLEERNNLMLKKLSHEIYRENRLSGEMEYGKGFVGKLLKKFNSLLNITSFDKSSFKIVYDEDCNKSRNKDRKDVSKTNDKNGHDEKDQLSDRDLRDFAVVRAENKTSENNGKPATTTSREGYNLAKSVMNGNNSLLGSNRPTIKVDSFQKKPHAEGQQFENVLSGSVAVNDQFCGDNIYEEISIPRATVRCLRDSTEEAEEFPRQNQVKETKSVFENFAGRISGELSGFVEKDMKSLSRLGTNSKFYGGLDAKKTSNNLYENPKKNLPDILLSNSPPQNGTNTPVDKSRTTANNKNKDSVANNKSKFSLKKNSDTKENSKAKVTLNDKTVTRESNFSANGSALTQSNTNSSTFSSSTKTNRPGSLLVRPSSNTPTSMQGLRPYKDIRAPDLGRPSDRSPQCSTIDSKPLSSSSSIATNGDRTSVSHKSDVKTFGPESFVISEGEKVPVTNIDSVLEDQIPSDDKSESSGRQTTIVTKATIKLNHHHPSSPHHTPHNGLTSSSHYSHVKSLLLDSPRSPSAESAEKEGSEPKEDDTTENPEAGVDFVGEGVIHKKSALTKSKRPKRKMVGLIMDFNMRIMLYIIINS